MHCEQICFGPFRLDPTNQCLWRDDVAIPLVPKTYAVLQLLVRHSGRPITKEELLDTVWSGEYVSDAVLKVSIGELRKLLGDHPHTPQYIETVHRRGYRFIASLSPSPVTAHIDQPPLSPNLATTRGATPLIVGRDLALSQLSAWFDRACQGERHVVFITGAAGIGKTTLVETFLAQLATEQSVRISHGQCIEHHGAGEAYLPLLEALHRLCRGPHGEQVMPLLRHHAPTWLIHLPALLPPEERHSLQREVVGTTRARMLRELAETLEELTAEITLVLVLEDLHWSDPSTLDVLNMLARRREPARLLLLGTYRPADARLQEHPIQGAKEELALHDHCQELSLSLLTEADVRTYLAARFPGALEDVVPELAHVLYQRTEGHPLFLVHGLNALIAQEVLVHYGDTWAVQGTLEAIELGVPESARQLILYQFERLSPNEQRVLEVASVVGEAFSAAAVATPLETDVPMVETWCDHLVRREQFLQAQEVEAWPDGTLAGRYRFTHALYRDVLYQRMSPSRRLRWHQRIGERLEAAYGQHADDIAAELAGHFVHGRQYAQAIRYHQRAGHIAMQRQAYREAIAHCHQGQALLPLQQDPQARVQQELQLQRMLAAALTAIQGYTAAEVAHAYTRIHELCHQLAMPAQRFDTVLELARFYAQCGKLQTSRHLGEQLVTLAHQQDDPILHQQAHWVLGQTLHYLGEVVAACTHLEHSRACYTPQPLTSQAHRDLAGIHIATLFFLALDQWVLGYPDRALHSSQQALTLAQELSHPFTLAFALYGVAMIRRYRGEVQAACEPVDALLTLARTHEFALYVARGHLLRGWILTVRGQPEEGQAQIRQYLTSHPGAVDEAVRIHFLLLLAEAHAVGGQIEAGLEVLEEAVALADATELRFHEAELYRLKGNLLLQQAVPDAPQAEDCFQRALELARRQQAKSWELRAATSLGRLWHQHRKRKEAYQLLAEVYNWFTEGFDTADLQEAKGLLEHLGA